jgi:archaellum biogenesis ATPase FlaH
MTLPPNPLDTEMPPAMTKPNSNAYPLRNGFDLIEPVVRPRGTMLSDAIGHVLDGITCGTPPVEWKVADEPWGTFAFRPHSILVVGGPTSGGKTAFLQYCLTQAMQINPSLRVLVANNESQTSDLVKRMISLLAGLDLKHIRAHDRLLCTPDKMAAAREIMNGFGDRLRFLERPFTVEQMMLEATDFGADIVCLDTLQKATLSGYDGDAQDTVRRMMGMLRQLADKGPCVVAAASLSRQGTGHMKGRVGATHTDEMDTTIFLHSSEIETNANDAFVLLPEKGARTAVRSDEEYEPIKMWLNHVKSRDDVKTHVPLLFDGRYQKFTLRDPASGGLEGASGQGPRLWSGRKPKAATPGSPASTGSRAAASTLKKKGIDADGHEWLS